MLAVLLLFFFFNDPATTEIYTLSLHDALPICHRRIDPPALRAGLPVEDLIDQVFLRSEEHTSELQSHSDLVCRLLLEKKKKPQLTAVRLVSRIGRPTPAVHDQWVAQQRQRLAS